jgi:hypothetical protein
MPLAIFLVVIALYGARLLMFTRQEMFEIRDSLKLNSAPDFSPLASLLRAAACLYLIVAGGLALLVWRPNMLTLLVSTPT